MTDKSSSVAVPTQENLPGEGHPVAVSSGIHGESSDPPAMTAPVAPSETDTVIPRAQPEDSHQQPQRVIQEPELSFLRSGLFSDFLDITRPHVYVNDPSATQRQAIVEPEEPNVRFADPTGNRSESDLLSLPSDVFYEQLDITRGLVHANDPTAAQGQAMAGPEGFDIGTGDWTVRKIGRAHV